MSKDLDYFTEFLANPAAYEFNEFYQWARKWGQYVLDHKDEFNYLEDDEWKEIRERLLDEFYKREDRMEAVEDEWEELCEIGENLETLGDKEAIKYLKRRLEFIKEYQGFLKFEDKDVTDFEKHITKFVASVRNSETANLWVSLKKINLDKSIAELDDELVKYYERTGKIPTLLNYNVKKKHDGN